MNPRTAVIEAESTSPQADELYYTLLEAERSGYLSRSSATAGRQKRLPVVWRFVFALDRRLYDFWMKP